VRHGQRAKSRQLPGAQPRLLGELGADRLVELVSEITWAENKTLVGRSVEVLVAEGEGRKDAATHRLSGRAPDNRLVHFTPEDTTPRPGDLVTVAITRAAPHYLVADGPPAAVRRTRAGDAWEARLAVRSSDQGNSENVSGGVPDRPPVALGMPTLARPV